jgi:hypothetical protein
METSRVKVYSDSLFGENTQVTLVHVVVELAHIGVDSTFTHKNVFDYVSRLSCKEFQRLLC